MAISSVTNTQGYAQVNAAGSQAQAPSKPLPAEDARAQPVQQGQKAAENVEQNRHDKDKQLESAVDNIQKFIAQSARDITFSIDQESGTLVKVIDRNSKDVIRQIPSEEVLAISKALDKLQGLFVQDKI